MKIWNIDKVLASEVIFIIGIAFTIALIIALNVMWWRVMIGLIAESLPIFKNKKRIKQKLIKAT